jgi:hypothetical protein
VRIKLSIGPATWAKALVSVVAVFFIAFSMFFMAVAFGMGTFVDSVSQTATEPFGNSGFDDPFFGDTPDKAADSVQNGFSLFSMMTKLMGLCGLPFALIGIFALLYVWRYGAWLDGTIVSKRGAFRTQRADLATAEISMGGINHAQDHHHGLREYQTTIRIPALVLTIAQTGRAMKIPLRGQGFDLLPASQLSALAAGLETNRSASAQRARAIGARLRSLAADPLAA